MNRKTKKSSTPDLMLIYAGIGVIELWNVGPDLGSDHLPIVTELVFRPKRIKKEISERWILHKLDVEKFQENLAKRIEEWTELFIDRYNSNESYDYWTNMVIDAFEKSCPVNRKKIAFKGAYWWNTDCSNAIKERRRLRRKLQRSYSLVDYEKNQNKHTQ